MLSVKNLHASVDDKEILRGIDLDVKAGEVHAIMGPNGSGKSTLASVLAGNEKFTVTAGSATFQGHDLLAMSIEDRARLGLFLGFQYPVEIPGVSMANFMKMAVQEQIAFEIVDNRYGLDPDEIIDAYGKDELIALSSRTLSWIDFLFEYLLTRYNLDNYSQKKEFAMEMADAIKHLQDDFEKESYYIRLRELTDFDMQEKNTAINERQIQKKETFGKRSFLTFPKSGRSHAEYEILSQMLSGISASNYYKEELGFLKDDTCNKLAIYIIDYYRTHTLMEIADLLDTIKEETVKTLALDIADWELAREEVDMEVLKEAVEKVKDCFLDDKIQMLNEKIKTVNDPMEKAKLAGEKNQLIKERGERLCQGRK